MKKPAEFVNFPSIILNDPRWRNATWRWKGVVWEHTDGDTTWFLVDQGFRRYAWDAMRYIGYDAWERFKGTAEERQKGGEATAYMKSLLPLKYQCGLVTEREDESLNRWVAQVLIVFQEHHIEIIKNLAHTPTFFRSEDGMPPKYDEYLGTVIDVADLFIGTEHEKVLNGRVSNDS